MLRKIKLSFKLAFESCKTEGWFLAKFLLQQSRAFLSVAISKILSASKSAHGFCSNSFVSNLLRSLKIGFVVLGQVLVSKRFHFTKSIFSGWRFLWSSQVLKIGFKVLAKALASLVQVFQPGLFFLAK